MLKELREFAIKGNVVDMAVGIIIGAAFTTMVKSFVDHVVMPPLSLLTGGLDFSHKFIVLREGTRPGPYETLAGANDAGATVLAYGQFINAVVALFLVALVLFFVVRWVNRLRRSDTPPAPTTRACPFCKSSIDNQASRCAFCTSEVDPL